MDSGRILIELKAVSKEYILPSNNKIVALKDVNLKVFDNEFLAIVGKSGSGKTNLLEIMGGILNPTSGYIAFSYKEQYPNLFTTMVFQDYALFPWLTVYENVAFGLRIRKLDIETIHKRCTKYLMLVGLNKYKNTYPEHLSGGMKQRIAIARALAMEPQILLMDEPFASVDAQTRMSLQQELIRIFEKTKKSIVFVTHSIEEAILLSDRVIVLSDKNKKKIKSEFHIDLPRPRRLEVISSSRFVHYERRIWDDIKDEK